MSDNSEVVRPGGGGSSACLVEAAPAGIEAGRRAGMRVTAVAATHDHALLAAADVLVEGLDRLIIGRQMAAST